MRLNTGGKNEKRERAMKRDTKRGRKIEGGS